MNIYVFKFYNPILGDKKFHVLANSKEEAKNLLKKEKPDYFWNVSTKLIICEKVNRPMLLIE